MKFFLFILFFFTSKLQAQITITSVASTYQTLGIGSMTIGTGLQAGKFYILITASSFTSGTASRVTIGNTGQTWTEIGSAGGILSDDNTLRMQSFRFAPTTTNTFAINFTYTDDPNFDGTWALVYEITGADLGGTNGSNAIIQVVTDAINSSNPTITMAAISNPANGVLTGFVNKANPFTGTPESSWTEIIDNGYNTPSTGAYGMYRLSTTDNTPTVTAASSEWAGMAIELKASRRVLIVD